jgi:hypothetical protein
MSVVTYPAPLYANLPIRQTFSPDKFDIQAITLGKTTTVTTTTNHDYVVGQQVRFIIPVQYGTRQLNSIQGLITEIPSTNSFIVDINSVGFDTFIAAGVKTPAQVKAIGNITTANPSLSRSQLSTFIPGSFRNLS